MSIVFLVVMPSLMSEKEKDYCQVDDQESGRLKENENEAD